MGTEGKLTVELKPVVEPKGPNLLAWIVPYRVARKHDACATVDVGDIVVLLPSWFGLYHVLNVTQQKVLPDTDRDHAKDFGCVRAYDVAAVTLCWDHSDRPEKS